MKEQIGAPDLILFTGDLAYSGTSAQYGWVDEVLDLVRDATSSDPLLVVVPGNHDLARPEKGALLDASKAYFSSDARRRFLRGDPQIVAQLRSPFSAFDDWFTRTVVAQWSARGLDYQLGKLPGDFSLRVSVDDLDLGFLGLNSAYLQVDGGEYYGKLAVEIEQLPVPDLPIWTAKNDATFLLMHHPPDWLEPIARRRFETDIYAPEQLSACVFGHMHESRFRSEEGPAGLKRRYFQASSLFGLEEYGSRHEQRTVGYAWVELKSVSFDKIELRRSPREMVAMEDNRLELRPSPALETYPHRSVLPSKRHLTALGSSMLGPPTNAPRPGKFVGRTDLLDEIGAKLRASEHAVTLWGLGGTGKTALAIEVTRKFRERYAGGIWWVNGALEPVDALMALRGSLRAAGSKTIREILDTIAEDAPKERHAELVKLGLQSEPECSLLVLDDVSGDVRSSWSPFLPSGRVEVLLTSRDKAQSLGLPIEVASLSSLDVQQLADGFAVASGAELDRRSAVLEDQLGGLALAVELACAYVADVGESWERFEQRLVERIGIEDPSPQKRLITAIDASLERAEESPLVARMLMTTARFAHADLRFEWVAQSCEVDPQSSEALVSLRRLLNLALVRRANDEGAAGKIIMHPLVWERARERGQQTESWPKVSGFVANVITSWHENKLDAPSLRELDAELPHLREAIFAADVSGVAGLRVRARDWLGLHALERASFDEAARLLEEGYQIAVSTEIGARTRFCIFRDLANLYMELDRQSEAEGLLREVLSLADSNDARVAAHLNLAIVLRRQSRLQDALAQVEQALALEPGSGLPEASTLQASHLLGVWAAILADLGRREEAHERVHRALAIAEAHLGVRHRDLVQLLTMLGGILIELGRVEEGMPHLERALAIAESEYGAQHPEVFLALAHLADAHRMAGNLDEARNLLEHALAVGRKVFPDGHSHIVTALAGLGTLSSEQGRLDEAIRLLEEALALESRLSDRGDVRRAEILGNLGAAFLRREDYLRARALLSEARDILIGVLGADHRRVAVESSNLARAYLALGDLNAAMDCARSAVRISRAGGTPIDLAKSLTPLGAATLAAGRPKEAVKIFREARELLEATLGSVHPSVAQALRYEAQAWDADNKPALAAVARARAAEIEIQFNDIIGRDSEDRQPTESRLTEELDQARLRGDWQVAAQRAITLGQKKLASGAWESARDDLRAAIRFAQRAKLKTMEAIAQVTLGEVMERSHDTDGARINYQAAARSFKAAGMPREEADARSRLLRLGTQS